MKVLLLICILYLATCAHAWTARGRTDPEKLKGHPNECWTEDLGYIKSGTKTRLPKQCAEVSCDPNGEYTITGCIVIKVEPPCQVLPGNLSKPFPDCCFELYNPERLGGKC